MSDDDVKTLINIQELMAQFIESEKYDKALKTARKGIQFCDRHEGNVLMDVGRHSFVAVDILLSPFYPEDKNNYPFESSI